MKSKLCFLFVLGMLLLFAANLNAQVRKGSFSVSFLNGVSIFTKDSDTEDSSTYGGSLGYNFSEYFCLEASYNTIDTKVVPDGITKGGGGGGFPPPPMAFRGAGNLVVFQPPPGEESEPEVLVEGGTKATGNQLRLEGLFYIYPGQKFAPYAALGIGQLKYECDGVTDKYTYKHTNVPVGFGFKYFINKMITIRADFRDVLTLPGNNLIAGIGATFEFGGR